MADVVGVCCVDVAGRVRVEIEVGKRAHQRYQVGGRLAQVVPRSDDVRQVDEAAARGVDLAVRARRAGRVVLHVQVERALDRTGRGQRHPRVERVGSRSVERVGRVGQAVQRQVDRNDHESRIRERIGDCQHVSSIARDAVLEDHYGPPTSRLHSVPDGGRVGNGYQQRNLEHLGSDGLRIEASQEMAAGIQRRGPPLPESSQRRGATEVVRDGQRAGVDVGMALQEGARLRRCEAGRIDCDRLPRRRRIQHGERVGDRLGGEAEREHDVRRVDAQGACDLQVGSGELADSVHRRIRDGIARRQRRFDAGVVGIGRRGRSRRVGDAVGQDYEVAVVGRAGARYEGVRRTDLEDRGTYLRIGRQPYGVIGTKHERLDHARGRLGRVVDADLHDDDGSGTERSRIQGAAEARPDHRGRRESVQRVDLALIRLQRIRRLDVERAVGRAVEIQIGRVGQDSL